MTMQPIIEGGEVVDEYDDGQPEETMKQTDQSTTALQANVEVSTQSVGTQKEGATEFDLSDVSIQIMLHRADGHADGRLVSVIIHNFSGTPVIETFREAELTEKSRLDSIHKAIYPLMQRFLLDLSSREQKKLEEEAKLSTKQITPKIVAPDARAVASSTGAATTMSTNANSSSSTSSAQTKVVSKEKTSKKGKQETKYQAIPMF